MSTAAVRDKPSTVIPGRAIGYSPQEEAAGWQENDDHWGNWLVGAGGVYASLNDLYQWDQALHAWAETGDRPQRPSLLPDSTMGRNRNTVSVGASRIDWVARPSIMAVAGSASEHPSSGSPKSG